jgi:hypothetical protein
MTRLDDHYQKLRAQLTGREREILDARFAAAKPALGLGLTSKIPVRSTKDRVTAYMAMARENFEKHQIVKTGQGRWLVRRPGTNVFWFEVVILAGSSMLVHGDVQAVMFGRYHPSEVDSADDIAWQMVHWMASRERPDDHYFVEKAGLGGTADETIWTRDEDTLRQEILELIDETMRAGGENDSFDSDCHYAEVTSSLTEALDSVGSASHEEVQRAVYEAMDGDGERVPKGRRISSAMVYAHAALQCLARLLGEQPVQK